MTSCQNEPLRFRRGATFDFSGPITVVLSATGEPVTDLTGWTATSQIRKPDDTLIADIQATIFTQEGKNYLRLFTTASTASWPVGAAVMDVRYVDASGHVVFTETTHLIIEKTVTRPA